MKRYRRETPSKFEVALEKGEVAENLCPYCGGPYLEKGGVGEVPEAGVPAVSKKFWQTLLAWGVFFNRLGGRLDIVYWVGIWASHQGNIKEAAVALCITPRALYARIARLEAHYNKVCYPTLPRTERNRKAKKIK